MSLADRRIPRRLDYLEIFAAPVFFFLYTLFTEPLRAKAQVLLSSTETGARPNYELLRTLVVTVGAIGSLKRKAERHPADSSLRPFSLLSTSSALPLRPAASRCSTSTVSRGSWRLWHHIMTTPITKDLGRMVSWILVGQANASLANTLRTTKTQFPHSSIPFHHL